MLKALALIPLIIILFATPIMSETTAAWLNDTAHYTIRHNRNTILAEQVYRAARDSIDRHGWPEWIAVWTTEAPSGIYIAVNDCYNISAYTQVNALSDEDFLVLFDEIKPLGGNSFMMLMIPADHLNYNRYITNVKRVIWRAP